MKQNLNRLPESLSVILKKITGDDLIIRRTIIRVPRHSDVAYMISEKNPDTTTDVSIYDLNRLIHRGLFRKENVSRYTEANFTIYRLKKSVKKQLLKKYYPRIKKIIYEK